MEVEGEMVVDRKSEILGDFNVFSHRVGHLQ